MYLIYAFVRWSIWFLKLHIYGHNCHCFIWCCQPCQIHLYSLGNVYVFPLALVVILSVCVFVVFPLSSLYLPIRCAQLPYKTVSHLKTHSPTPPPNSSLPSIILPNWMSDRMRILHRMNLISKYFNSIYPGDSESWNLSICVYVSVCVCVCMCVCT